MLAAGSYPEVLKRRIRGPGGHLSNDEAAIALREDTGRRLRWACLCHLSEENNTPDRALQTHRYIVGRQMTFFVAGRYTASDCMTV